MEELCFVLNSCSDLQSNKIIANLGIVRGLNYYTGTIYERSVFGYENFGSVCSGGRYDELLSIDGTKFPGVGISIGITRILSFLFAVQKLNVTKQIPHLHCNCFAFRKR